MLFRLSYITNDFNFGETEIKVSNPDKGIEIVYKKRPNDGELPAHVGSDGLIVATCHRALADRLREEAINSGILSRNKEAVQKVFDDMVDAIQRTVRLARWKTNAIGGPDPIRMGTVNHFVWSVDGSNWKQVADSIFMKVELHQIDRTWSSSETDFLQAELVKGADEPLGHALLREANINRIPNPRSALILGVAAAEVGFKQFASRTFPDTAWLLELPSPPLVEMIQKFPWKQLKLRINGKIPGVPESIIEELRKGVTLRNKTVHSGIAAVSRDTLESLLDAVKNLLYFLDVLHESGQHWPINFLNLDVFKDFKKD
jgi:hypothetical protein